MHDRVMLLDHGISAAKPYLEDVSVLSTSSEDAMNSYSTLPGESSDDNSLQRVDTQVRLISKLPARFARAFCSSEPALTWIWTSAENAEFVPE
jgi:hypothetical protein